MPQRCSLCDRPDFDKINKSITLDVQSLRTIATRFNTTSTTIYRHKTNCLPTIVALAAQKRRERDGDEILDIALVNQVKRLERQSDRWDRLHRVIDQRAEAMKDVKEGGDTGLLARKHRWVGSGEFGREVEDYAVDAPMLKEIRELEKQTSEELGQFKDKDSAHGGAGPAVVIITPQLPIPAGITLELPEVSHVRFPHGRPTGFIEADSEPIDASIDVVEVIDAVVEESPTPKPLEDVVEEGAGRTEGEEDEDYF